MTTLSTDTVVPKPGAEVILTLTLTENGANFVRLWLTDAPKDSTWYQQLHATGKRAANRLRVHEGSGGPTDTIRFVADKGGVYVFEAQEYEQGDSTGAKYLRDPNAPALGTEAKLGNETELTLSVAQQCSNKVGSSSHNAELVLTILGSTIVDADLTNGSSPLAKQAIRDPAVEAALTALVDDNVTTAIGDLDTILTQMVTEYEDHRPSTSFHPVSDAVNTTQASYRSPKTPIAMVATINRLLRTLGWHISNDAVGAGVATGLYHGATGADTLQIQSVAGPAQLLNGVADFHRVYESHRVNLAAHTNGADNTNSLTALPALLSVYSAFLSAIASLNPTAPASVNAGVTKLISTAGFTGL